MIERFKVEGVAYVVSYDEVRSIFTFYIDVLNSDYNVAPLSREARMWGDVSPDTVWTKTDVKDVLRLNTTLSSLLITHCVDSSRTTSGSQRTRQSKSQFIAA